MAENVEGAETVEAARGGFCYSSIGAILVLFILLVIISRAFLYESEDKTKCLLKAGSLQEAFSCRFDSAGSRIRTRT
ncbi:hypothetical protein SAMN05880570_2318 [Paenibacillus sp. RU4T]|nr:hypothetical protein SAMN05880555_2319 [Paenibacillus sp. RU4X]SIQ99851.1 hypothetical protein SAMN05880570_2318 [Paenibacillus sp. RU4T]